MGEALLRNSQLQVVLGAGVAAGCLDSSCSGLQFSFGTVEEEVDMNETLMRNSELEIFLGAGTAGSLVFR
ncbi:unnamed protein product [Urochloa humidicola]